MDLGHPLEGLGRPRHHKIVAEDGRFRGIGQPDPGEIALGGRGIHHRRDKGQVAIRVREHDFRRNFRAVGPQHLHIPVLGLSDLHPLAAGQRQIPGRRLGRPPRVEIHHRGDGEALG